MKSLFAIVLTLLFVPPILAESSSHAARAQAAVLLAYHVVGQTQPRIDPPAPSAPDGVSSRDTVTYRAAHEAYTTQRRPMVVMVSANWCPYCPSVRASLESMLHDGQLQDASLVVLDYDADAQLACEVMGTRRQLPFVALFTHEEAGPRVFRAVSTSQLPSLLKR